MNSKKGLLVVFFLTAIISIFFAVSYLKTKSEGAKLLLLISDNTPAHDPTLLAWKNTLEEAHYPYTILTDDQYLKATWRRKTNYPGIILPDHIHREISPATLGELIKYLNNGGKLLIVYDAATLDVRHKFFTDRPPLAAFIGVDYNLYQQLKGKISEYDYIGNQKKVLQNLGIPEGKFTTPSFNSGKNFSLDNPSEMNYISTYEYGLMTYPHLITNGHFPGKTLLKTANEQLIAGVNTVGKGKIVFVNLPLGYSCLKTDCMLQQVFVNYFAQRICQFPQLAMVPDGKGGLIINLHLDSSATLKLRTSLTSTPINPLEELKKSGLFAQGPYSVDITAGPDTYRPGDGLGLDVLHNAEIIKWIHYFQEKNYAIGDHGGWAHDYFGKNINDSNAHEFAKYLNLNDQALKQVTASKIYEYAAPVGNQPAWVTAWLNANGFSAYYTTGNTGSWPTRPFIQEKNIYPHLWSFPILSLDKAATFEEFYSWHYPESTVKNWLVSAAKFVAAQHTVRIIYFHPHGIFLYPTATLGWLAALKELLTTSADLQNKGEFSWYTMVDMANFLNNRLQVAWQVEQQNHKLWISASHPQSLKHQTWLIAKNYCDRPQIITGNAEIVDEDFNWAVIGGEGKNLQFSCALPKQEAIE